MGSTGCNPPSVMIRHSPSTWRQWPGRLPALVGRGGKAVHQPQRGRAVAAVLHEGQPFGIGDEVAGEPDRADQGAVRRLFIVEMETVVGMPDGVDALVEGDPFLSRALRRREAPRRIVGRRDRVLRKGVQDVGQHQFLMLLLVVEADLDQRRQLGEALLAGGLEELDHGGIDMPAIGGDFVGARAGEVAALVAGVPGTGADIIGIEQKRVVGVEGLVALAVLAEQELLEEPGGMGAVPFGRAGVRHRLDQLVLGAQGSGPALGLVADGQIGFHQILGERAGIGEK